MTSTFPITNRIGGIALSALMLIASFPTVACQNIDQQIQADGAAIAAAVQQIAALEKTVNADLSNKLTQGATALLSAIQNWKTGGLINDINTAASVIEVALAAIPATAAFSPLVPIAVAALETLLANLPTPAAAAAAGAVQAHVAVKPKIVGASVIKHRFGRTVEGDFKAAWNSAATKVPGAQPIS